MRDIGVALFWIVVSTVLVVVTVVLAPVAVVGNVAYRTADKRYEIAYYFNAIAVGLDALGGSLIYGSKRHTISAVTGYRAYREDRWHIYQERLIDAVFGENHCFDQAVEEKMVIMEAIK